MTRDEAKAIISDLIEWYTEDLGERLGLNMCAETYMDALEVLWHGPEGELISRADAIEAVASRDETDGTVKVFTGRQVIEILSALPSAEAVQGWIPCSERLPEMHTEYVIENPWMQVSVNKDTYQLSNPVLGYGKRKYHSDGDPMMAVVRYEDDGDDRTGWITEPDCEDIDVIAWMPLPKPYKGGDDE